MKRISFLTVLVSTLLCSLQLEVRGQTLEPFAKHYWLNPGGVNYTFAPINNGTEWIMAAPRSERINGAFNTRRNTIAVFKVDNAGYSIIPTNDDVSVIGLGTAGNFERDVEFEVHSIVQSCNPNNYYILCGSIMRSPEYQQVGMVAVLDQQLNLVHMREYPDVRVFYSVYAQDNYYFVCGQMHTRPPHNATAILLRDNLLLPPSTPVSITAYNTLRDGNWEFHKIAVRNQPCSFEISVSGSGGTGTQPQQIGWAVFYTIMGTFSHSNAAYTFSPPTSNRINSRVALAYYPPGMSQPLPAGHGLLLSASTGNEIFNYVFLDNQQQVMNNAFRIPWRGILTDMDCGGDEAGIAWVGNKGTPTMPQADYLRMNNTPPFSGTVSLFSFYPFNNLTNSYYSLHKVHYASNDQTFHAGGYYQGQDEANRLNRGTFAVTPEKLNYEENSCVRREILEAEEFPPIELTPLALARVYIGGNDVKPAITVKYGFCVMDCDRKRDEDCGNRRTTDDTIK